MANDENWIDIGHADDFSKIPLKRAQVMNMIFPKFRLSARRS